MDITESFRASDDITKPSDLFDFVVNADDHVPADDDDIGASLPQFNRSLKSLGIYLEASPLAENNNNRTGNDNSIVDNTMSDSNNNSSNIEECNKMAIDEGHRKEQNNNHLMITNGGIQYADGPQSYWSGAAPKDDPVVRWDHSMLEDLDCWSHENGTDSSSGAANKLICSVSSGNLEGDIHNGDTDGAIYTLTVLNGSDHGSTWYRLPETAAPGTENDRPADSHHGQRMTTRPSSVTPSIDFDSLLNNILPNSIPQMTGSTSFPSSSYLTVNSQEVLPQPPGNDPAAESTSSPIKPTEFLYEDTSYHENNSSNNRGPLRISYNSSTDNCNSNRNSNSSCSSSNNNSNTNNNNNSNNSDNPDWRLSTASDARVNSLLRNALQGKSSPFMTRYNGSPTQIRSHGVHSSATMASKPTAVDKVDGLSSASEEVTATVPVFSDVDDGVETHSPLMAVSLESGTVVVFDGGRGAGSISIDSDNPSSAHSMDDIFLSQLDAVGYGEDYEKLKSIENEVAESVERYCANPYFGSTTGDLTGMPSVSLSHRLDHALSNALPALPAGSAVKNSKKYSKRSSNASKTNNASSSHGHPTLQTAPGNGGSATPAGIRKERSLHYCTICHKGFKDKYSVNVHVRTHTGEKPFTCTFCGKNFRQKAHLAKHHHTHSVQKTATGVANKPHNTKHR